MSKKPLFTEAELRVLRHGDRNVGQGTMPLHKVAKTTDARRERLAALSEEKRAARRGFK